MLRGVYDQSRGGVLLGTVFFPPPIADFLEVRFLIDTGSSHTCLAQDDLIRLGSGAVARLRTEAGVAPIRGIGSRINPRTTEAFIGFSHNDGGISIFTIKLPLLAGPTFTGLPSILGRDILFHGELRFDPSVGGVYFDPPKEDIQV
jgi:hypothetical protein